MFPSLITYISKAEDSFVGIRDERKELLVQMAQFILKHQEENPNKLTLNFICTHNSRRSHYGQIWAAVASEYYGDPVTTFSGGTEATAFNKNAIQSLRLAGLNIKVGKGYNPMVDMSFSENREPLHCFSKLFDHEINPKNNFAAIMTCSEANENCPFVPGALRRFALTYEDPKIADDTPEEANVYNERCFEIATEMFYLFNQIKENTHVG